MVETKQTRDVIPAVTCTLIVLITCSLHDSEAKLSSLGWPGSNACHMVLYGHHCNAVPQQHGNICLTLSGGQVTISGAVSFQLETEPSAGTPVFTLTFTSTGGPATTVSWTRDSNAVTANNDHIITSRVTDRVEATYVHALRVTGRQEGSYRCSVSNSRTSPAAVTTLQIAGKEPEISSDLSCIAPFLFLVIAELSIHYFTFSMFN